jgi:hypothetical protein
LIVANLRVEDLSCLEEFLIIAAVTALLDISLVWLTDELLKIREVSLSALGISEDELGVNHLFLKERASHEQVLNKLLIAVLVLRGADYQSILCGVAGLDESINCFSDVELVELSLTDLAPDLRLVDLLSILSGSLDVLKVDYEDTYGLNMLAKLLVNAKSLIIQLILVLLSELSKLNSIIVIKTIDVIHDTGLVSLDSSQDQEVL